MYYNTIFSKNQYFSKKFCSIPNCILKPGSMVSFVQDETETIQADTIIGVLTKVGREDEYWESIIETELIQPLLEKETEKRYGSFSSYLHTSIEAENQEDYLYRVELPGQSFCALYKVDKENYSIQFVTEARIIVDEKNFTHAIWRDISPELNAEFPN